MHRLVTNTKLLNNHKQIVRIANYLFCLYFGSEVIIRFGNDPQKEKYLRSIIKRESTSSLAYLEKDQGSNFTSFKSAAQRNGNRYLINGNKSLVTFKSVYLVTV